MVFDSLENAKLYYGLSERIEKALKFLSENDFTKMEEGKVEIDGDNIYAMVVKYKTKEPSEGRWENHRKYIDVQYLASGSEVIGFVNEDYLDIDTEYNEENDIQFFKGDGDYVQLNEQEFVILYPQDAHMPQLAVEESEEVLKVVIKVKVD